MRFYFHTGGAVQFVIVICTYKLSVFFAAFQNIHPAVYWTNQTYKRFRAARFFRIRSRPLYMRDFTVPISVSVSAAIRS